MTFKLKELIPWLVCIQIRAAQLTPFLADYICDLNIFNTWCKMSLHGTSHKQAICAYRSMQVRFREDLFTQILTRYMRLNHPSCLG